ncbi:MAG: hypothetical protein IKB98_04025 [Clostridia bacterium]|nr:hypothetical protein [Clostridia bacterium]
MAKCSIQVNVVDKESAEEYLTFVITDWKSLHVTHPKVVKALKLLLDIEDVLKDSEV